MVETSDLLDELPVGVAYVAYDGGIARVNPCLASWLMRPPQALLGSRIDQWLTRAGRVLYHTHVLPTLQLHGQLQELSLSLDIDGRAMPVLASASLVQRPGGAQVLLVLSPMRERLRVEAELQRARRSADAAPALLFEYELDAQGRGSFGYLSAGLWHLSAAVADPGHVPEAVVWRQVHPEDLPGLMQAREVSAREHQVWTARFRARADGDRDWAPHDLLAQPSPLADGGMVWHGTIADISRQHEMEQAARLREAAEQASRAKSEFLTRMSHELRTPLNGIVGFTQLLSADGADPLTAEQRRRLEVILACSHRLLGLINELLDIASIEAGRLLLRVGPVPLQALLRQAVAAIEPMAESAGLTVALACGAEFVAQADEARLAQVMANLLSNAVKYNHRDGGIRVQVREAEAQLVIEVQDDGPGLSPEQCSALFQPFNRLGAERTAVEGSGLGLVIARHLVEAMGGQLLVDSAPGQGSCFSVVLHRAGEAAAQAPVPPADHQAWRLEGPPRRVLYVEDDPVNALLVSQALATLGPVTVQVVGSGAEALEAVAAERPDLLLVDMHLSDMDGLQLLRKLREVPALHAVPMVAVSAAALPADRERALAAGFQGYWTKPLDLHRLRAEVVQRLSASQAPRPPRLGMARRPHRARMPAT